MRAAVERLYAARKAEDADTYFALGSQTAQRPRPEEINYLFASGDDKFSSIAIANTLTVSDRIIVRVSVVRDRTSAATRGADGSPAISHATLTASLTFVREDGDWKLLAEGRTHCTWACRSG